MKTFIYKNKYININMTDVAPIEIVLPDFKQQNIDELLLNYNILNNLYEDIEEAMEKIKKLLTKQLKDKKWTTYKLDKEKINISLIVEKKDTVNKNALKMLLTDEQYNQIVTKKSKEKLLIVTPKDRQRLITYVAKQ